MQLQITTEYCSGGSVSDLCHILEAPLSEDQIALICKEALKVFTQKKRTIWLKSE